MNPDTIITLVYSDGTERQMTLGQLLSILNSRVIPQSEGRVTVKVTQINLYTDEETGDERYIANLNALAPDQEPVAQEHFANGEYAEALNIQATMNLRTTASFIPTQGQLVQVDFAWVRNREDTADVLRPVSISPLPKASTKRASFGQPTATDAPDHEPNSQDETYTREGIAGLSATELKELADSEGFLTDDTFKTFLTSTGAKVKAGEMAKAVDFLVDELV